jgi:hypothetical protein
MKRFVLSMMLALGVVSTAQAVPPCWPGSVVNVGPARSLSPLQLNNWWVTHTIPVGVANPHYYVAFHASNQVCQTLYGASAWAKITGPSTILSTLNGYTISQGLSFQCQKCSGGMIELPVDPIDK